MNRQLVSKACELFAQGFSMLAEAVIQPDASETNSAPAAKTAATPEAATAPAKEKKSPRKSAAAKAAPAKSANPDAEDEEPEDNDEIELDEAGDDGEDAGGDEGDDLDGIEDEADEEPAVTAETLRTKLVSYAQKHGKEKAYGVLAKFNGAKKVADVKEKDFAKLDAALSKGLK